MPRFTTVSLDDAFDALTFLPDRRPETDAEGWFSDVAACGDGAGSSRRSR